MSKAQDIASYRKNGWHPVPYRHHPPVVKEVIRAGNFRPKMKACFENCTRFMLQVQWEQEHRDRFHYCEGLTQDHALQLDIPHAWLLLDGQIVDLTLAPGRQMDYHASVTWNWQEFRDYFFDVHKAATFGPFKPMDLDKVKRLEKMCELIVCGQ